MSNQDWLMRQIEQAARVAAAITMLRDVAQFEAAEQELTAAARSLLGISGDDLRYLELQALQAKLGTDPERRSIAKLLLRAAGFEQRAALL